MFERKQKNIMAMLDAYKEMCPAVVCKFVWDLFILFAVFFCANRNYLKWAIYIGEQHNTFLSVELI